MRVNNFKIMMMEEEVMMTLELKNLEIGMGILMVGILGAILEETLVVVLIFENVNEYYLYIIIVLY